ncbi:MAG: class I SAM-dependent methyltransferase [Polyangiaceae bacterium]|nr:class I SAM-dependent methyltransferase [Polyangiaceae bacterium]
MNEPSVQFDRVFADDPDPWRFRTRWYEARKRALTVAVLLERRYASGYEPGCANGELSAALAERCDVFLASDASPKAVALAAARLSTYPHAAVEQRVVPSDWPSGTFDLVALSELAYYLPSAELPRLAERTRASLRSGGTVVGCHWRAPIAGCEASGDEVVEVLHQHLGLFRVSRTIESDFRADVWSDDPRGVSAREGWR